MEAAESILTPIDTIIIASYLGAVLVLGYLFSRYVNRLVILFSPGSHSRSGP